LPVDGDDLGRDEAGEVVPGPDWWEAAEVSEARVAAYA